MFTEHIFMFHIHKMRNYNRMANFIENKDLPTSHARLVRDGLFHYYAACHIANIIPKE